MYSLIISVLALVILIYMFDIVRKKSTPKVKRIGLLAWFGAGVLVAGYGLYMDRSDPEMLHGGYILLAVLVVLFWVLPTGALLYLDTKSK